MPVRPRCLHPVRKYERKRPRDQWDTAARDDPEPVCWRPKGHPGNRHASRASYERMQARERHYRELARMSDPGEKVRT